MSAIRENLWGQRALRWLTRERHPWLTCVYLVGGLTMGIAAPAGAIPVHKHGQYWTGWEADGNLGAKETHDHTGAVEAGDVAHQHYLAVDFKGWNNYNEPFSAFGAWNNETAHLDKTDPFEGGYPPLPHGYIEDGQEPDYFFKGDWSSADATAAKPLIIEIYGIWSSIAATRSPASGKPLVTGIGFTETATEANAEIVITWENIPDDSGGGVTGNLTEGQHTSANPITIKFDSSYNWEFTKGDEPADDDWDLYSVAFHEICHTIFLFHQSDNDLKDPSCGEPKNDDYDGDGFLWHWDGFVDNMKSENDFFTGKRWQFVDPNWVSVNLQDKDSVDGAKSLYSIPLPAGFDHPPEESGNKWSSPFPYQRNIRYDFNEGLNDAPQYFGDDDDELQSSDFIQVISGTIDFIDTDPWISGRQGMIGIDNRNGTEARTTVITIHLDNWDREYPYKKGVWKEVEWVALGGATVTQRHNLVPPGYEKVENWSEEQDLGDGWRHGDFWWKIIPNPPWEEIEITYFAPAGGIVMDDFIHVATECVTPEGACCDHATGTCLGWMTEAECMAQPPPIQPEFFKDQTCNDPDWPIKCTEHEGACCDHATGNCLGWMTEAECMAQPPPSQPEFFKDQTCNDPDWPIKCTEHEGACCDHATGSCLGWMTESDCVVTAEQPEFFKDITCSDPGFDCWEHTGACCEQGYCTGNVPESACDSDKWWKDTPCSDPKVIEVCAAEVPTVSQWALIVMTLLLLTGGMIVVGRQRRAAAA